MDKPRVVNLLAQVQYLICLLHLVVCDQCLVDESEAVVESLRTQFGNLSKNLSPLVLDLILVVVENSGPRPGELVVIVHRSEALGKVSAVDHQHLY